MFNIGAGEFLVILVIALVVLGPERLPEAIRKVGQVMGELRKLSAGFQDELRDAMNEPLEEMRSTVDMVRNPFRDGDEPAPQTTAAPPEEPARPQLRSRTSLPLIPASNHHRARARSAADL